MEIKAGFIDGNITYEKWRSFLRTMQFYKVKMDQEFCLTIRKNRGRNDCTWVECENFSFVSTGTRGGVANPLLFQWELRLYPDGTKEECRHAVYHYSDGNLTFYDGAFSLNKIKLKKTNQELEQKQREVERILALALEQYQSTYDLVQDKEFFLEQVKEQIYLWRFDLGEREKSIIKDFADWIENFLRGERELPAFIQDLTYESAVKIYPEITTMGVPENELRGAVERKLQWIKGEKSFGSWITEYKDEISEYIKEEIDGVLEEKRHLEKERKKEVLIAKYTPEKLMEIYASKLSECANQEKTIAFLKEVPTKALCYVWDVDEEVFLQNAEREIDGFLCWEQMDKEAEEFRAMWGSDSKIIELTEEKKARFAEIEVGTCTDVELVNEYNLYCELRADYEELIYRKNKKGLRPTFTAIPAYFAYFCQIIELAKRYALIDGEGKFLSWDNFDDFEKAVKRYEKSLCKSE